MAANWQKVDADYHSDVATLARLQRRPPAGPSDQKRGQVVELIEASTLPLKPIRWLWPGWLARGKYHAIAGAPATGKTTITMDIAARISSGRPFPCGSVPRRGRVLIWSGEDDAADTLVPRLKAAGADLSMIRFVGDVRGGGERTAFDPSRDVPALADAIGDASELALLIVDPIVCAVSGDSHKNGETRRGLAPLVDLAARLDAALLGVTHYSKGTQGRDPVERVSGSLAFAALARIVWGTVKQQPEGDALARLVLARAKSNIGPDGGGFAYAFEQADIADVPGLTASRIAWSGSVEGSARDLLGEPEPEREVADDAAGFLRELLSSGPMAAKAVLAEGNAVGYSRDAMHRAKRKIGAHAVKKGMHSGWSWELPQREPAEGGDEDGTHKMPPSSLPSEYNPPSSKVAGSVEDGEGGALPCVPPSALSSTGSVEVLEL